MFLDRASRSESSNIMKGNRMEIEQACKLFAIITGTFAALGGMLVGVVLGYLVGLREGRNKWNLDKLKRSDHYHYERKDPKL